MRRSVCKSIEVGLLVLILIKANVTAMVPVGQALYSALGTSDSTPTVLTGKYCYHYHTDTETTAWRG